jgi:hypothetical protein
VSQYLAIVATRNVDLSIERWLRQQSADYTETFRTSFGRDHSLTIISRGIVDKVASNRFFVGVAVDADNNEIGFGLRGWQEMRASGDASNRMLSGGFLEMSWGRSGVLDFRRDFSGSVGVLETHGNGWYAFSDSMLVLARLRRHLSERVTPNHEVLLARSRTLAITHQQMSNETIIDEVAFFPGGSAPQLVEDSLNRFRVETTRDDRLAGAVTSHAGYREVMRRLATQIVGQAVPLAGAEISISLSGGQDSRLVLGAYRRAGSLGRIHVTSYGTTSETRPDFEVAKDLTRAFGISLNGSRGEAGADRRFRDSPLPLWASHHLGLYDRFLPGTRGIHVNPLLVRADGTGAGLLKGAFGWRTLDGLDHRYGVEQVDAASDREARHVALVSQLRKGMIAADIDPGSWNASEMHYASYRNGLHGSAGSVFTLLELRLVQQSAMLALSQSSESFAPEGSSITTGIADLLALVDPELAAHPFLDATKNRTGEQAAEVQERFGGPLQDSEIPAYSVYGEPSDGASGPSEFALRVAESAGFGSDGSAENLLALSDKYATVFDDGPLRRVHARLRDIAGKQFAHGNLKADQVGPSLAKILTPGIFAF